MTDMRKIILATVCGAALMPVAAGATTITGWNTDNVEVGPVSADGVTESSVIYDRDPAAAGATSNGRIDYTAPEANTPGMLVEDVPYVTGGQNGQVMSGCIRASSTTTCDGDFQSGKRFKEVLTDTGAVDLVFDVDPSTAGVDGSFGYQVFHRLVNLTGQAIESFTIELGFGVGDTFTASTAGDGLGFSAGFETGPADVNTFSQYPFGLFGDASTNPNFTIDGFFDSARTGLMLDFAEDVIASNGMYGGYEAMFGDWLSQDAVPEGLFWDYDGPTEDADPLLMAWFNGTQWEVRREVNAAGDYAQALTTSLFFDPGQEDEIAALLGIDLTRDVIEDLANLNVNYAILLGDNVGFDQFTLRVNTVPAPIPLPATAPLMAAGIGALGLLFRRRRRAAA